MRNYSSRKFWITLIAFAAVLWHPEVGSFIATITLAYLGTNTAVKFAKGPTK
jgi:hypothetical protein